VVDAEEDGGLAAGDVDARDDAVADDLSDYDLVGADFAVVAGRAPVLLEGEEVVVLVPGGVLLPVGVVVPLAVVLVQVAGLDRGQKWLSRYCFVVVRQNSATLSFETSVLLISPMRFLASVGWRDAHRSQLARPHRRMARIPRFINLAKVMA
jgi:hypothetical protein